MANMISGSFRLVSEKGNNIVSFLYHFKPGLEQVFCGSIVSDEELTNAIHNIYEDGTSNEGKDLFMTDWINITARWDLRASEDVDTNMTDECITFSQACEKYKVGMILYGDDQSVLQYLAINNDGEIVQDISEELINEFEVFDYEPVEPPKPTVKQLKEDLGYKEFVIQLIMLDTYSTRKEAEQRYDEWMENDSYSNFLNSILIKEEE